MIILENAQYMLDLGCGSDVWALFGNVYGHPAFDDGDSIFVSTPKVFNEEANSLTTSSDREYIIGSYIDKEKVVEQIKKDIEKKGYEVYY